MNCLTDCDWTGLDVSSLEHHPDCSGKCDRWDAGIMVALAKIREAQ